MAGEAGDVLVQGILDQETHSDVIPDRRKYMMTMMTWMMMNKCHYESLVMMMMSRMMMIMTSVHEQGELFEESGTW